MIKTWAEEEHKNSANWMFTRFGGAWMCGCLEMGDLDAPVISNRKARFYFTEKGFKKYGPAIIQGAKESGQCLQVIRRKNPKRSQIVYKDKYQLAILPMNKKYNK